jgi:hypothetical protein
MKRIEKKWKVEVIREKISTNDNWLFRGILAIHSRQTDDEKASKDTIHHNKIGFTKADSRLMSSFAEVLINGGTFSETMLAVARRRMSKYASQLTRIANSTLQ